MEPYRGWTRKGLAVDDTTFQSCNRKIPGQWPNSPSILSSLRLFKAWDENWGEDLRHQAWQALKELVHRRKISVLVGTQVTCNEAWNKIKKVSCDLFYCKFEPSWRLKICLSKLAQETDDDREWDLVLELLQLLGRDHIMGVAVPGRLSSSSECLCQPDLG